MKGKGRFLLATIIGYLVFMLIIFSVLSQRQMQNADSFGHPHRAVSLVGSEFSSASGDSVRIDTKEPKQALPLATPKGLNVEPRRYSKMFVGLISSDHFNSCTYRKRHRELFRIWNDARVCSLYEYKSRSDEEREPCQLIYTFIIGAGGKTAPTEIIDNSTQLFVEKPIKAYRDDVNDPDVTLLNIQENMNEGKSQTFFYYASTVMEEFGFEYAMKLDADAMLHLHDYFLFAHNHLPPKPYNTNIFGGAMRNKAGWPAGNAVDQPRKEYFFGTEFTGVHLYMAGQMYFMSLDLCQFVANEAPYSKVRLAEGGYLEGHEDHDIGTMVFHSPTPIHMMTIGKSQRFWEHPVKGEPRWKRIVKRETARMARQQFEGRMLRIYLKI